MEILVVDDSHSVLTLISSIIDDLGYNSIAVNSGERAVEAVTCMEQLPDLVILDVNMEGMDGYETGRALKTFADTSHLPIIFLTGAKDPDIQAKCLAIGDDYIAKPFSVEMVIIKIKAHLRVSQLTKKMQEKNQELRRRDQEVQNEHKIVESIFTNQFQKHINHPLIRYHMSPASVFNGDVLLVANGPSNNTYLLIGDATGHGLAAAVGAIPIYSTFRTMASKGLTVGSIAAELNHSLLQLLPGHMMLAAAIIEITPHTNELQVWAGGLPNLIIATPEGAIKQQIQAFHPPLAAMETDEFSQNIQVYPLTENDKIFLFTDGIEEARNIDDEMFGEQRLHALFKGDGSDVYKNIKEAHEQFTVNTEQDDDITLVEFIYRPDIQGEQYPARNQNFKHLLPWNLQFSLKPDDMRRCEPIPQIIHHISNAAGVDLHQDFISTILSELYNNALEHGLLKLDSDVKNDTDGFINYYQLRRESLEQLTEGQIDITLEAHPAGKNSHIVIEVTDTGQGYNYETSHDGDEQDNHGRGLMLTRQLCEQLLVSNGGRTTKVIYKFQRGNNEASPMANILIVDDSPSMRNMVSTTLVASGHKVDDAVDGQAALLKIKTSQYDAVISDINMPNMDGIELVRQIRSLANYKYTPVLLLTTESANDKKLEGKSAGATGWLVKPFNPEKLISTVERVLR